MNNMSNGEELLSTYVESGSEAAFRELVGRYVDFVYSVAFRLVQGHTQLAEDVTQTVFINLAKKAPTFTQRVMLGGWLHQHTYHVATKAARSERRRQIREQEAVQMQLLQNDERESCDWEMIAPIIDEALTSLEAEDRCAIVLRFFERRDFRSIGQTLRKSEDAARMRVNRALEKLRTCLSQRGVCVSVVALGGALWTQAVSAAPAALGVTAARLALKSVAARQG